MIPLAEIEDRLNAALHRLDDMNEDYREDARLAAIAEADYRDVKARTFIALIEHRSEKMTQAERQARTEALVVAEHKEYLLRVATRDADREALLSLRSQIEVLRTLAASARHLSARV